MTDSIRVFAPATIGNIGPGFDVLGMAINGIGDVVEAARIPEKRVIIENITGDEGLLPRDAEKNTAGIAARHVLDMIGAKDGISLVIHKQMPSGSGLGSSAASAAGAAYAVNCLHGSRLSEDEMILCATKAEEVVSGGFFADNTAPCILGGATLTRSCEPLDVIQLGTICSLIVVIVSPDFELLTKHARAVMPKTVALESAVANMANACLIVAAFSKNDYDLLSRCINDRIAEPARAGLIPGFYDVKSAALNAGAHGCTISGAGPSVFAITNNLIDAEKIEAAMKLAFLRHNLKCRVYISHVPLKGVRKIE
ncbi:MAG: homoserine kinase [archaeon]